MTVALSIVTPIITSPLVITGVTMEIANVIRQF